MEEREGQEGEEEGGEVKEDEGETEASKAEEGTEERKSVTYVVIDVVTNPVYITHTILTK